MSEHLPCTATAVLEDEMQNCSLIRKNRKRGPDVWLLRWSDKSVSGKRIYRSHVDLGEPNTALSALVRGLCLLLPDQPGPGMQRTGTHRTGRAQSDREMPALRPPAAISPCSVFPRTGQCWLCGTKWHQKRHQFRDFTSSRLGPDRTTRCLDSYHFPECPAL